MKQPFIKKGNATKSGGSSDECGTKVPRIVAADRKLSHL